MITPRRHDSFPPDGFSVFVALPSLAALSLAIDVMLALLLVLAVLLAVCLLWRKKSPRQQFVLDLMKAESETENTAGVFPEQKLHEELLRRTG